MSEPKYEVLGTTINGDTITVHVKLSYPIRFIPIKFITIDNLAPSACQCCSEDEPENPDECTCDENCPNS